MTPNIDYAINILDNCSIHHAKKVRELIDERNIHVVWNVPYCPQFNGIELYWAQTKEFKKLVIKIKTGTVQAKPL